MSCVEYECLDCKKVWSDNKPPQDRCISCASSNIRRTFDEQRDREAEMEARRERQFRHNWGMKYD